MGKKFILSTGILILIFSGCNAKNGGNFVVIENGKEEIKINVEIAENTAERARGLMFRQSLDENSGMLFVFDEEKIHSFWMKNTLIPLDMIWISKEGKIVDIRHAVPCKADPCISYIPAEETLYVLEVNGNFSIKNGIKVGNKVQFRI